MIRDDLAQLYIEECQSLREFVLYAQNFVRIANIDRVSLSIRGMVTPNVSYHSILIY
jgi:hypothetical protein